MGGMAAQPTALIPSLLLVFGQWPLAAVLSFFLFFLLKSKSLNMKKNMAKSSCSIRFDSRETAAKNAVYFTVNASYEGGFVIIISGVSDTEWKLYGQIIELLRQKKINIEVNRW
jgi:hypothetical protein